MEAQQLTESVLSSYNDTRKRLELLIAKTPDDKLNWSPSSTARTPLELLVHSAGAVDGITNVLDGKPMEVNSLVEFDTFMRDQEKSVKTKQEALEFLDKSSKKFEETLKRLAPSKMGTSVPFFAGMSKPFEEFATFPAMHMRNHIAQLEYVQTIWGDHDWYMS